MPGHYPTYQNPTGSSVKVTIPPGWYTLISGLSRKTYNQTIRLRYTEGSITNTEYLDAEFGQGNDTMRLRRTWETSYALWLSDKSTTLELTFFYSPDQKIKDKLLEKENAIVEGLSIRQIQTPSHMLDKYPQYVTFFVFVQDAPKGSTSVPLYNDVLCTITLIKGTGLGHDSILPNELASCGVYPDLVETDTGQLSVSDSRKSRGRSVHGNIGIARGSIATRKPLDIVFLQDATSSQVPYIQTATKSICHICRTIASSGHFTEGALRIGLLAYRDHPPQDTTFVTKSFGFTSNVAMIQDHLKTLSAEGGGDGPEAVTAALAEALSMDWRADATKMVILITDAPPHGIGEKGDGFPAGSPDGKDPLDIARKMAREGISIYVIACEPSLSHYAYAVDFYHGLASITSGLVLPLTVASHLADYIIGASLETVEMEALISKVENEIARRVFYRSELIEDVVRDMHARFTRDGVMITTLSLESVYETCANATHNMETYMEAIQLSAARVKLLSVDGPRLLSKFVSGQVSPTVRREKKPISEAQTRRIVKQGVTRNAGVEHLTRPSVEAPVGPSIKINIPAGWFVFVAGLCRAKCNQTIRLKSTEQEVTNTEYLTSQLNATDETMKLKRTQERFYVFVPSKDPRGIALEMAFYWSKANIKGSALAKNEYGVHKLHPVEIGMPMHLVEDFPDFVTYLVLSQNQANADQIVTDNYDGVGIVHLIKNTPMVKVPSAELEPAAELVHLEPALEPAEAPPAGLGFAAKLTDELHVTLSVEAPKEPAAVPALEFRDVPAESSMPQFVRMPVEVVPEEEELDDGFGLFD